MSQVEAGPVAKETFRERLSRWNRSGSSGRPLFSFWGLSCAFLIGLCWYLYRAALEGPPIWDDKGILTGQSIGGGGLLDSLSTTFNGQYYRPLTSFSYALDLNLFGRDEFYFHTTNNVIHIIGALLALWAGYAVTRNRVVGLLAGLFFAFQTSQLWSAGWVGGRTDALSCVFIFALIGSLATWQRTRLWPWLAGAVLAFFCAVMTKEQNILLCLLAPLSEYLMGQKKPATAIRLFAVFAGIAALFMYLWLTFYPAPATPTVLGFVPLLTRVLTAIVHYTGEYLTPTGWGLFGATLSPYEAPWWPILGAVLLALYGWGFLVLLRRAPALAWLAVGIVLVYLPISNIIPIPSLVVAPYRVSECGPFIAILLAASVPACLASKRRWMVALPLANLAWCAAVAPWGISKVGSEFAFFEAMDHFDPHGMVGAANYLAACTESNRTQEVATQSRALLQWMFGPKWDGTAATLAACYASPDVKMRIDNNLGVAKMDSIMSFMEDYAISLEEKGQPKEALALMQQALRMDPGDKTALNFLGSRLKSTQPAVAINYFQQSLFQDPDQFEDLRQLATLLAEKGNYGAARDYYRNAAEQRSWLGSVWTELADIEVQLNNVPGAVYALRRGEDALLGDKEVTIAKRKALIEQYNREYAEKHPPSGPSHGQSRH